MTIRTGHASRSSRELAEEFRTLLRTEAYPLGSQFRALPAIREHFGGITKAKAYEVVRYLQDMEEIRSSPGVGSTVLPEPLSDTPLTLEHAVSETQDLMEQLKASLSTPSKRKAS